VGRVLRRVRAGIRRLPLTAVVAAVLLAAPGAGAAPTEHPWATVNVCDVDGERNVVGIRGGMPGNGTSQRMYMRFELQWYRASKRRYVRTGPPSRWVSAGSARFRVAQRGWDFTGIPDPPEGRRFKLRGLVRFEWRELRGGEDGERRYEVVVRRARRITRGGLRGVEGGRPPGRSDAVCMVVAPAL
jgi:hypothetical protein